MRRYLYILFFLFLPAVIYAGGSTYSRYGFGDLIRYGDSRLFAMSGTGIALLDDGFINGLNPAGMARIANTRFSGGFEYNRFSSKDANASSLYSTGGFQGLAFAIPISTDNGIVLSMEASPYSTVRFASKFSRYDNLTGNNQTQQIFGSGGLSNLGIGLSASILNSLHLGGHFSYLFGRTRYYQKSSFDNSNYSNVTMDESIYYSGFMFTIGMIYEDIYTIFDATSLKNLSLGLTFSFGSKLDAEKQSIFSSIDSVFTKKGTAEIPISIGFGLAYQMKNNYRILSDIYFENWEKAKQFEQPSGLRNSFRAGLGFEKKPTKSADTYFSRLSYRLGLAYNATYYKINGIGINELTMSGGLGLPLGIDANLNLGLQVGFRGTTDNNLQKDTIIRISVAISASEIWFLKFEEE